MNLPPLPDHPEPWAFRWTNDEMQAISEYGEACAKSERENNAKLCEMVADGLAKAAESNLEKRAAQHMALWLAHEIRHGGNPDAPVNSL